MSRNLVTLKKELEDLQEKEFMVQMIDHWTAEDFRYSNELHDKIKAKEKELNEFDELHKYKLIIKVGNCEVEDPNIKEQSHIVKLSNIGDLERVVEEYMDCDYQGYRLEEVE